MLLTDISELPVLEDLEVERFAESGEPVDEILVEVGNDVAVGLEKEAENEKRQRQLEDAGVGE